MKQRLISALAGLVILAVVLIFLETAVFNGVVSVIAVIALHEFFGATKINQNRYLAAAAYLVAAIIPFIPRSQEMDLLPMVILPYIGILLCILLATHNTTRVEQVGLTFLVSLGIPLSLTSVVYLRDAYGPTLGLFYLILALGGAWFTDSGAYFVGCSIGKHKMTPVISPHKTWEGAVGGVVVCILMMLLCGWVFAQLTTGYTVQYQNLAVIALIVSIASMIGDLSASLVKRQFGIKDFGNIMPGHGGVLDRFDSLLFVAPLMWGLVQLMPIVKIA